MIYMVGAVHWAGGWELHIIDVGVTQSRTLEGAEAQVRDYLETVGEDHTAEIKIVPDLDVELFNKILDARRAAEEAARLQSKAAAEWRESARELREAGLSVSDTATVMGVSRGRVSQLLADA